MVLEARVHTVSKAKYCYEHVKNLNSIRNMFSIYYILMNWLEIFVQERLGSLSIYYTVEGDVIAVSRDDNRAALRYNRVVIKNEYILDCFYGPCRLCESFKDMTF